MVRRKGEITKAIKKRQFGFPVVLEVPPRGFGRAMLPLDELAGEVSGKDYATWSHEERLPRVRSYWVFGFRSAAAATRFEQGAADLLKDAYPGPMAETVSPFEAALRADPLSAALRSGDARHITKVYRNARWQGRSHERAIELARKDLVRRHLFMTPMQSLDLVHRVVSWASREHFEWFWKCIRRLPS